MVKKGSAAKMILGGLLILLSCLESETMIPWYIKVVGGLGLMIYGLTSLLARMKQ